jgi:hypothetical protein
MKLVKMKDKNGGLYPRVLQRDVSGHLKNGWTLVEDKVQVKLEKKKSVKAVTVEADINDNANEENE